LDSRKKGCDGKVRNGFFRFQFTVKKVHGSFWETGFDVKYISYLIMDWKFLKR
jgi:hypothetical protein